MMEKDIVQLRMDTVAFIEQKIKAFGEPCFVEYYDFFLKHLCLSGVGGIKVSVNDGKVYLGDDNICIDPHKDSELSLRDLGVIAEAMANPENLSHHEKEL